MDIHLIGKGTGTLDVNKLLTKMKQFFPNIALGGDEVLLFYRNLALSKIIVNERFPDQVVLPSKPF